MASRLTRLQKMVQADLDALPDRPPTPDDDTGGGVVLEVTPTPDTKATEEAEHVPPKPDSPAESPPAAKESPKDENTERRFVWLEGAASSYNLGAAPKLSPLPQIKLAPTELQKGDLSRAGQTFSPIQALSRFPYRFCNQSDSQEIATAFFDAGKFWVRHWDLYYVWDVDADDSRPLILVLESQVDQLLKEINSKLNLKLKITDRQREDGLIGSFPDHPRCLPRYLGRSTTREEHDDMAGNVPSMSTVPLPEGRTLEDFKKQIEEMWDIQKKKKKAAKGKQKLMRFEQQKVLVESFKRAQRYLGLRPTAPGVPLNAIDPALPTPFPFDKSVVFVCVDVEAYERDSNKITEVGIATLDTRDLIGPPGVDGKTWHSKIKARHFRIEEYLHLVNRDFVSGCPDKFEFGKSEVVSRRDAPDRVAACFKPPFCSEMDLLNDPRETRNLIFLGHDTLTDVEYLQKLGFDPLKLSNVLEAQDSAKLYRVWRREPQITQLGRILVDFDIVGWHLHNAGNDAVYTVQAMLGVLVREATIRGSPAIKDEREEQIKDKVAKYTEEAQEKAQEEVEGWSETEGNGGPPEPIVMREKVKPTTAVNGTGAQHTTDVPLRPGSTRGGFPGRAGLGHRSRPHRGRHYVDRDDPTAGVTETDPNFRPQSYNNVAPPASLYRSRGETQGRERGRGFFQDERGFAPGQFSDGTRTDRDHYPEPSMINRDLIDLT